MIMPVDQHLYVEGLLYLEKDDKAVEAKLRFYPATSCTTSITHSLNNIIPLAGTILKDRSLNEALQDELDRMQD